MPIERFYYKYLKTFIRLVIEILIQYSITQPEIVPKLVVTFRSPTASFIRLYHVFWSRAQHHVTTSLMKLAVGERNVTTNLGNSGCVIEYCFSGFTIS